MRFAPRCARRACYQHRVSSLTLTEVGLEAESLKLKRWGAVGRGNGLREWPVCRCHTGCPWRGRLRGTGAAVSSPTGAGWGRAAYFIPAPESQGTESQGDRCNRNGAWGHISRLWPATFANAFGNGRQPGCCTESDNAISDGLVVLQRSGTWWRSADRPWP